MMFVYIVLFLLILMLIYIIIVRNKLIIEKNKVKESWAQVDVDLKKRADLIPNLVDTVKEYTKHEKSTLEEVIEIRNRFNATKTINEKITANDEITTALNKLFALGENYPDLKASDNFLSLQSDLKSIEDDISLSRKNYNDAVLNYNNKVSFFPSNIVASLLGYNKEDYYELNNELEREVPKVKFWFFVKNGI